MSETKTKTATTAHGEVQYETITCDSCGNEAAKEESSKFVMMHDMRDTEKWTLHGGYKEYKVYDYTEGWACQYCTNDPASFPKNTLRSSFKRQYELRPALFVSASVALLWLLGLMVLNVV